MFIYLLLSHETTDFNLNEARLLLVKPHKLILEIIKVKVTGKIPVTGPEGP
jgi:hypothetical protein